MTWIQIFQSIGVFILGCILGSFLNVCIHRLPRRESIIKPRSHCPHCGRGIKIRDNIPILSYLILRGHCRYCGEKISPRYPFIESVTGLLLGGLFLVYGWSTLFLHYALLVLLLIPVSIIDIEHKLILNVLTIPGMLGGLALTVLLRPIPISSALLGLILGAGSLYLIAVIGKAIFRKESMGGGDIKLAGMIGVFLGLKATIFSLFLAFLLGALAGISLIIVGKARGDSLIPFGPFIALGALLFVFCGQDLLNLYLGMF